MKRVRAHSMLGESGPAAMQDSLSLTEALVGLCGRPVDRADLDRAAMLLADWIGVAFAGSTAPAAAPPREWTASHPAAGACSAIGLGSTAPEQAAFVNGSLGTLLEMDDLHRASILHAGDVVMPAALAAAQHVQAGGRGLLEAITHGYEVALRIGMAAAAGGYSAWYNSGTCGVFGAAMAAARAAGLPPERTVHALGQAGMQASGLWQCRLEDTDSKCLATAHAARAGVTSAFLACRGLRGARRILEGPLGFFATFYPKADAASVLNADPGRWLIHDVSLKPWPACRHVHAAIGAALDLREQIGPEKIGTLTVHTYEAGRDFCDDADPSTTHEARFSFQHAVAVTLLRGAPTLADFGPEARNDPDLAALRRRIDVRSDDRLTALFPNAMGARLEVETTDHSRCTFVADHAFGDPEQPMTPDQIAAKFQSNTAWAGLSSEHIDALRAAVDGLAGAGDLSALSAALDVASAVLCDDYRLADDTRQTTQGEDHP